MKRLILSIAIVGVVSFLLSPDQCGSDEELQWYATCGDPVCHGWEDQGYEPCTRQEPGDPCENEGEICDPHDFCNVLYVCATEDPTADGCPISRAAYKTGIHYLEPTEIEKLANEVLAIPLVTYTYKAQAPNGRTHLGFLIDDIEPSPAVDGTRDRVDLYGYTTMAVAGLQRQARQIEALEARLEALNRKVGELGAALDACRSAQGAKGVTPAVNR